MKTNLFVVETPPNQVANDAITMLRVLYEYLDFPPYQEGTCHLNIIALCTAITEASTKPFVQWKAVIGYYDGDSTKHHSWLVAKYKGQKWALDLSTNPPTLLTEERSRKMGFVAILTLKPQRYLTLTEYPPLPDDPKLPRPTTYAARKWLEMLSTPGEDGLSVIERTNKMLDQSGSITVSDLGYEEHSVI